MTSYTYVENGVDTFSTEGKQNAKVHYRTFGKQM